MNGDPGAPTEGLIVNLTPPLTLLDVILILSSMSEFAPEYILVSANCWWSPGVQHIAAQPNAIMQAQIEK